MNYKYGKNCPELMDYGPEPLIFNIDRFTKINPYFRVALWTGEHFQLTLMSIPVGESIGLEMHDYLDQFIRIESGYAFVEMGSSQNALNYTRRINENYAIIIPAGTWHNITNIGDTPLKVYSIYAPPQHPFGTIHVTKADSEAAEKD